jgi:two-component system NtrC family sensor kinase
LSLLSKAVEQSADMVVITDAKGVVQYVNPAFSAFTGLSGQKVVGGVLPKPYAKFGEIWNGETEIPTRSGMNAPVHISVSPLVDERGKTTGSVGVGTDMTEHEYLQERLVQSEKLVGLGILASGIAHEINNPLSGILGMAEAIRDENDPALIKSYANDIVQYTLGATEIVRELDSYSRLEPDETTSTINIAEVMEKSLNMAAHSTSLRSIKVNSDLQRDCLVIGSRVAFQQIFVNLIQNAIQAMSEKGALSLECRKNGDFIVAKVTDTGKGIPKEQLNKVFDPFFTTKPTGKGTGLGLYVVYKIILKFGGQIKIESDEGKGTSFILKFPAIKAADAG